jgi:hypothetical protein
MCIPWGLKLNSGGRKRPLGRRVFGSLSSSKNGWINASNWKKKTNEIKCDLQEETMKNEFY